MCEESKPKKNFIWWRDLSRTCGGDSVVEWFDNGISWKLGEGDRVRFWLDNWMGDSFDTQISKIISHIFTRKLVC